MTWVLGAVVGLVLVFAGTAKLSGRDAWRAQARALGAPPWVAAVLPPVEVVLGAVLVFGLGSPWAALAAAGLLTAFTVAVVVRLARGQRPPCACFGRVASRPIGPLTVVRNVVLVGLAVAAAVAS